MLLYEVVGYGGEAASCCLKVVSVVRGPDPVSREAGLAPLVELASEVGVKLNQGHVVWVGQGALLCGTGPRGPALKRAPSRGPSLNYRSLWAYGLVMESTRS